MTRMIAGAVAAALLFASHSALATDATMYGTGLHRQGRAIHMKNFDVTLDGRLLTASRGIYHTDTGIVDLTGRVQLHFGPRARTFPGEVR